MSAHPSNGPVQALRLYNTLTRAKDVFRPIDAENVRMYVCGPTVYDDAHIGNARPIIVFDTVLRVLKRIYGDEHVTYVRNITDVDDKINARAAERGISIRELTEVTAQRFHDDVAALGTLPPTVEPRATDHIPEMRQLIERLVARGVAYVAEDHVLFSVEAMGTLSGMPRYGALANRSLDEMLAGARVEVAPYKRDAMDFVLWKPAKAGEPGWDSPCGIAVQGRPGWHIECSAMSWRHLVQAFAGRISCEPADAQVFDIHGGGIDLVFPHHEDEIAQSCCALDAPRMANYWLHNGFLQVEGQKMSKSLGNFVTIRELLTTAKFGGPWSGPSIRLAMLETHYRQPIDWTETRLARAEAELEGVAAALDSFARRKLGSYEALVAWAMNLPAGAPEPFLELLSDDLNTAGALGLVRADVANAAQNEESAAKVVRALSFLGLLDRRQPLVLGRPMGCGQFGPQTGMFAFSLARTFRAAYVNGNAELQASITGELALKHIEIGLDESGLISFRSKAADEDAQLAAVNGLLRLRADARAAKNWAESDRIRGELSAMGVVVKDNKDGTTSWEIARPVAAEVQP